MKILTYNVLDGFENEPNRKKNCANWIKKQTPDIVFLNELNHFTPESFKEFSAIWDHQYSFLLCGRSDYRIGITSKFPLTKVESFYHELAGHGLIICQCNGVTLLNTHLNPHSIKKRHLDLDFIIKKIESFLVNKQNLIFGGDLNSLFIGEKKNYLDEINHLRKWYELRTETQPNLENLINGQFDFSISERLQNTSLVDLLSKHNIEYSPSYLSKLRLPELRQDAAVLKGNLNPELMHARIDYLWASPILARNSTTCFIPKDTQLDELSDHYPIIAIFEI